MSKRKRMVDGLLKGLKEAEEHSKGTRALRQRIREIEPAPEWTSARIRRLRVNVFDFSQPYFAAMLNVKTSTVRSWEQGQKKPSGAAARLLQIIEMYKDKDILERLVA